MSDRKEANRLAQQRRRARMAITGRVTKSVALNNDEMYLWDEFQKKLEQHRNGRP